MMAFSSLRTRLRPVLFALLAVCAVPSLAAEVLDRIVAQVNDQVILRSELDSELVRIQLQIQASGTRAPEAEVLEKQVLEKLILTRLQTQRAKQAGITVSDNDVNDAMTMIAQRNGVTQTQLLDALKHDGIDLADYQEQLRDEITIARLRQREVDSRVSVTEQDVDLFLNNANNTADGDQEYHLRHLLIAIPASAGPEVAKAKKSAADAIYRQLVSSKQIPQDFAALALAKSDGQQALEGGDLGWINGDELPTIFMNIVPQLKVGEVSPVLEAESGYHLVLLEGVRSKSNSAPNQELHLRHILIRATQRTPEQASALIEDLYQRLQKGEDFSVLAKQYSEDPGSKTNGGDLSWQNPDNFDPAFRKQVVALKDQEISKPFESTFGWHIAQLLEHRQSTAPTANDERQRARISIYRRRIAEDTDAWLRRLRDEAYVELRLGDAKPAP